MLKEKNIELEDALKDPVQGRPTAQVSDELSDRNKVPAPKLST